MATSKKLTNKTKPDPCWEGYEMAGMKTKKGKKVPNCIPEGEKKKKK